MADKGPAGQTEGQEGNAMAGEAGTCGLERVQGCCLDVPRWDQESQDTNGTELDKGCKELQEEIP